MSKEDFNREFKNKKQLIWQINITNVKNIATGIINEKISKSDKEVICLLKKIRNAQERTGGAITETEILQSIISNNTAAFAFAKDPLKQNFAENFQFTWLHSNKKKYALHKLPSGRSGAIYLVDGELITGLTKKPTGSNSTKSIDFNNNNEYYYAKHTEICGGAQDNQCEDGKKFVEQANKYCSKHKDNKVFILLIDGAYYTEEKKQKIRSIVSEENKHRVRVCGCYEV